MNILRWLNDQLLYVIDLFQMGNADDNSVQATLAMKERWDANKDQNEAE